MFDSDTLGQMECLTLDITDDEQFEEAEPFTFQLITAELQLSINPARRTATMTILDRQGE